MKKFTFTPLTITRLLGVVFLWMNLGHAPDLHAQARKSALDFTLDVANTRPFGLWSNGTTMWVTNKPGAWVTDTDAKIYAYNLKSQARDVGKDFDNLIDAGNANPTDLWSDGTTMWVVDEVDKKFYAYNLKTKVREEDKDFDSTTVTESENTPKGLWSNGTTMWELTPGKFYVYNLKTKARDADKDFNISKELFISNPYSLWSDGTTMWFADWGDTNSELYAYSLATKARDAGRDFNTLNDAENRAPAGIWSNDTTMWVSDFNDGKLYAYALPKKDQTITFTFSTGIVDDTLDLSDIATASSGLEVTYSSSNTTIAEVGTGTEEGKLILKAAGDVTITANQAGDDRYLAAPDVTHTITVNKKDQTITFTLSGTRVVDDTVGDTLNLSATASSGLDVTYMSSDPSIAEVGTGTEEGKLILKAAGDVTITANQAGDDRYLKAPEVTQNITVRKKVQTITFTFFAGVLGDTLDLSNIATASSMLEVTYVSSNSDIAEVGTGTEEGKLILKALGNAMITANQAGDDRYLKAPEVTHTITVSENLPQTITFNLSADTGVIDDTLTLSATASSMLEVSYVSSDPSIAEVGTGMNAGKLILKALGNATITANQAGDDRYLKAPEVTQNITVSENLPQTITFNFSIGVVGDTLNLSDIATASSMLEVSYVSSDSDIAEVSGDKLILKALGNATITASQAGDARYLAAPEVTQNIIVRPKQDFTLDTENRRPLGLWSNDTTLWVSDTGSNKIYAYSFKTKTRDSTQDFNTLGAENTSPRGLWSDGTTMWVAGGSAKIYAYNLATKNRNEDKDIELAEGNAYCLWVNDTTMWVGDNRNDTIYAYNFKTKARDITQDFNTLIAVGNTFPTGIWSDGTTMWIADLEDDKIYAYNLTTKARNEDKDIELAGGSESPESIWSDGTIMWIAGGTNLKLYAYLLPQKDQTITFTLSADTGVIGDTLNLSATASSGLEVTYSSSDPSIAEVGTGMNANKLILKTLGNATITASQAGDDRYLKATEVTQSIIVSEKALGVDVKNTDIRVWPNPVATQLNISSGSRGKITITLRNLTGQRLQERELEGEGQMDLALVPAGVYLLHIRTAEETTSYLIYKE